MMQKKIGTILDEGLLERVKQRAHQQHITLNRIFEEALSEYLLRRTSQEARFSAVEASFGALKLPKKIVQKIAQEDIYETE